MHRLCVFVTAALGLVLACLCMAHAAPPASDLTASLPVAVVRAADAGPPIVIGSKRFTESYVLGEVLAQAARAAGAPAEHRPGLGTTGIVFAALAGGAIDVYVEYTGTIARDILALPDAGRTVRPEALDALLAARGLGAGVPLGFDNSYALAMRRGAAAELGIGRISDLAVHPGLRLAFTQEFLALSAGWPGLARTYGLAQSPVGIEHGLAYRALATGRIDVKEVYTTDAQIDALDLVVLDDDRGFFPRYDAVLLYRRDVPARFPAAWRALQALQGRIDTPAMRRLNAAVEIGGQSFAQAASDFLTHKAASAPLAAGSPPVASPAAVLPARRSVWRALVGDDLARLAGQHLLLVGVSLAAAVAVGVPLGVLAQRRPALGAWLLGAAGVAQTVPSLALLALLIALLGRIGTVPALLALSVYALLPVMRNTAAGLDGVGNGQRDAARALGLRPADVLRRVELPLAMPVLLAGVQTAAVLNVGTATIAAFVGAGGFGERIVQGLALNDAALLLAGALPSAAMALLVQAAFAGIRRLRAPAGRTASRPRG